MQIIKNRRGFMTGAAAAGTACLLGTAWPALAEPPPETTSVRLPRWIDGAYCWAGLYLAGELLRAEGFTDIRFVQGDPKHDQWEWIARGETDFSVNYAPIHIASIEKGVPIKVLTGLHAGCLELIAREGIADIKDLRGRRVGIHTFDSLSYVFVALMAAYVGLDPVNDIEWVIEQDSSLKGFLEERFDAYLFTPPAPQRLRAERIGRTILNTNVDRPWSQHFCCMVSATSDYVNRYPVATKRVLRAILKGADLCASDPAWSAAQLVERDFLPSYDYALQTLSDTSYGTWRNYDAEDSMRFFALRMHQTGMIKSTPQQVIAKGTDWRFLEGLRRELKM
jgi:NitT/TauT family transport system substrate-binding protein